MESFLVSARKYRPKKFDEVIGQSSIVDTLSRAIESNHLAQALLFCGPRGVGKTTCARILAKKINEDSIGEDEDYSFNIFELDAASNNSVDDIRNLTDQVRTPPQIGKYKVYIIDEVHMLSQSAFNAFLKTLEEPPKHTIFILATTEIHKIIPTILSRCQIFEFRRISVKDIKDYLKKICDNQGVNAEDGALHIIAMKSDGALRDALSIFDRMVSFCGKKLKTEKVAENLRVLDYGVYLKITNLILENKIAELLLDYDDILSRGFDGHNFVLGFGTHLRDLMLCLMPSTKSILELGDEALAKYFEQSKQTNKDFLLECLDMINQCDLNYKKSQNQRLLVELCLMQMASIQSSGKKKNDKTAPPIISSFTSTRLKSTLPESLKEETGIKKEENPKSSEMEIKEDTTNPSVQVSSLSISSIKYRKEIISKKNQRKTHESDHHPKDAFTEETLLKCWHEYIKQIEGLGFMNIASILRVGQPKLCSNYLISLTLPNNTMERELLQHKRELLEYLKKKLNNHSITLKVEVDKEEEKKYAFLPEEKYTKLKDVNPNIELLSKTFGLELS